MTDIENDATVDVVIRRRRTAKLMREPTAPGVGEPLSADESAALDAMIELAGWAPVHYRAHASHLTEALPSIVPWRFHVLERDACGRLLAELGRRAAAEPESAWARAAGSKIPALIAAAGALVQVTWLPEPAEGNAPDTFGARDVEHVAAASAAVQNLLLAAEARGWSSYWSSGGVLREPAAFDLLGIDRSERLLGSIFLAPPGAPFDRDVPGGLREGRGTPDGWSRRVTLD